MNIPIKDNSNLLRDTENNAILGSNSSYDEFIRKSNEKIKIENSFQHLMIKMNEINDRMGRIEIILSELLRIK
jgi:hypothetical protein